jgi:hypothetical protein
MTDELINVWLSKYLLNGLPWLTFFIGSTHQQIMVIAQCEKTEWQIKCNTNMILEILLENEFQR